MPIPTILRPALPGQVAAGARHQQQKRKRHHRSAAAVAPPAAATFQRITGTRRAPQVSHIQGSHSFPPLSTPRTTSLLHTAQQGAVRITLISVGNFTLPTYASATISPATEVMIAGGTASADLAISTSSVPLPAVARGPAGSQGSGEPGAPAAALAALLLLLLPLRPSLRERLRGGLALLLLGVLLVGTNGCGADIRIPFHLVPTGTYQIPVTATDANHNTQTALLTLTVTP